MIKLYFFMLQYQNWYQQRLTEKKGKLVLLFEDAVVQNLSYFLMMLTLLMKMWCHVKSPSHLLAALGRFR